jgi:DMSO/TMAO reductase YedYZ molybdopterin-dependent catalytic subunit
MAGDSRHDGRADDHGDPSARERPIESPRPPGPFRAGFWRSPLRGLWFTSLLSAVLLAGLVLVAATGVFSYAAYDPWLPGNDTTPGAGFFHLVVGFGWPTGPRWLYRLNQGVHVLLGLALLPVVLAKLWAVIPKLFTWPPARSVAHGLERVTLLALVGGVLVEIFTGLVNISYDYSLLGVSFYTIHLYTAWFFIGAFILHVVLRTPAMIRGLRSRRLRRELRTGLTDTGPEQQDHHQLAPQAPAPASMSRRGALGLVGGSSLVLLALSVGQTLNGPIRRTALLAPRGRVYGSGPDDFQVNETTARAGIRRAQVGPSYRLRLRGPGGRIVASLSRADLLAMPQRTYTLPIACVEGWSTSQTWTGVRLRDLAARAGVRLPARVHVRSLPPGGPFAAVTLSSAQLSDGRALLALKVGGADLSLDHGYPARTIIPAAPGVHNTKWVATMAFHEVGP